VDQYLVLFNHVMMFNPREYSIEKTFHGGRPGGKSGEKWERRLVFGMYRMSNCGTKGKKRAVIQIFGGVESWVVSEMCGAG
jgi:hypothetical protein